MALLILPLALVVAATTTQTASAGPTYATYGFSNITNTTNFGNAGAAQLSVQVDAVDTSHVSFTFKNAVGITSNITEIYFDDGTLFGISNVTNSAGVAFTGGSASPGNLPGGTAVNFHATSQFSADVGNNHAGGVNVSGELVTITFALQSTYGTAAEALKSITDALALGLANPGVDMTGGLRMGLHVTDLNPSSDSFVNGPSDGNGSTDVAAAPEPASMTLLGIGLAGMAGYGWRRTRQDARTKAEAPLAV